MAELDNFVARELEFDLTSEDENTRRNALLSLARMEKSVPLLDRFKRIAADDQSAEIRYLAKKYYNQIKESLAGELRQQVHVAENGAVNLDNLTQAMASPEVEIRLEALRQTVEAKDRRALQLVKKKLQTEQDLWVIATLVKAVGVLGDPTHISLLQPYLKNTDSRVVANTVEALELIGGELVFPILVPMMSHADHRVAGNAVKALVKFDREQALAALDRMTSSDRENVRDAALYCLSILTGPDAEQVLIKLFANETFSALIKKEAQVLAKVGTRAVLPEICRLLKSPVRDRAVLAKFVQKEIAQRENVSVEELVAMEDQAPKPPPEPAPRAGVQRRTTRRIAVPTLPPPPPTGWQLVRQKLEQLPRPVLAGAAVFLLLLMGAGGWMVVRLATGASGQDNSVLARVSRAEEAKEYEGKAVQFAGVVRGRSARSLVMASASRLVMVSCPEGLKSTVDVGAVRVGQALNVAGKIAGKNRFGGVYVDAESLEATR